MVFSHQQLTNTVHNNSAVGKSEKANEGTYVSKAEIRKTMRKERNGPGRNQCLGGRVEKSKGFPPNSFDRVLLDAPCSALGLRPRLFAGEVGVDCELKYDNSLYLNIYTHTHKHI